MKYLKMYESFKEDIHEICKKYGIENYKINDDFSVDVNGDVNLDGFHLRKLPLKFGKVTGSFDCSNNSLTSLVGCPNYVGDYFGCGNNQLTTLIGCPKEVVGSFYCAYNKLTSLEGCPKKINGYFSCANNQLTSLEGPSEISCSFDCSNNKLTTLEYLPKLISRNINLRDNIIYEVYKLFGNKKTFIDSFDYNYFRGGNKINKFRLTQALAELDIECPEKIKGYIWE